jgi:hypothetical protein
MRITLVGSFFSDAFSRGRPRLRFDFIRGFDKEWFGSTDFSIYF